MRCVDTNNDGSGAHSRPVAGEDSHKGSTLCQPVHKGVPQLNVAIGCGFCSGFLGPFHGLDPSFLVIQQESPEFGLCPVLQQAMVLGLEGVQGG